MAANPKPSIPLSEPEPADARNLIAPLSHEQREAILARLDAWIEERERLIAEIERRIEERTANPPRSRFETDDRVSELGAAGNLIASV